MPDLVPRLGQGFKKDYWSDLVKTCTEEFMRLCEEAEKSVYDYVAPAILEVQPAEQRQQFYEGLDWGQLKQTSPHLWAKYSKDALDIQGREAKKEMLPGPEALQQLRDEERIEGFEFQRYVQPPTVFGLKTGVHRNTGDVGLDSNFSIPMGKFG